jgi:diguanylate cyclase (GGDEF)-like protein
MGWTKMAQHFLLGPAASGARQYRVGQQSIDLRYELRSSRLVLAGIIGVMALAAIFIWGTFVAVYGIDGRSVEAERNRAMIALGLAQQSGHTIDSVIAQKIGRDYVLVDARLALPNKLRPEEVSVPVAGLTQVLAWTPRRFGSETAGAVAPVRIAAATGVFSIVVFILFRLYRLARDLEARRRAARDLASRDSLTGLANRRGLNEALEAGFAASGDMALLYLDLDDFKLVNDRFGHATGDQLLLCVAQRLAHTVGPADLVARLGGDEFVVLRRGTASPVELTELANRIHSRITLPYGLGDVQAEVGLSIGIAVRSPHMTGPDDLLGSADAALYRAKAIEGAPFVMAEALVEGLPKAA